MVYGNAVCFGIVTMMRLQARLQRILVVFIGAAAYNFLLHSTRPVMSWQCIDAVMTFCVGCHYTTVTATPHMFFKTKNVE